MTAQKIDGKYLIRINKGEEVRSSLTDFCIKEGIDNALVTAIGAVEWISCGYYDLLSKEYRFKEYDGMYEVLNATANVILNDGKPFVHMHATFSDENNNAFGGHVDEMRVGVVLEVVLELLNGNIERKLDKGIGLCLMDLGRGDS